MIIERDVDAPALYEQTRLGLLEVVTSLSDEQRVAKAMLCLEPALGAPRARALVDAIGSLEKIADVRELARGLA